MPTRRNKLTGEVAEFSDDGEKIRVISPGFTNQPGQKRPLTASQQLDPRFRIGGEVQTEEGEMKKEAGKAVSGLRFLGESIPVAANILGDAIGGPAAGIVGSLIGSQIQSGLRRTSPEMWGEAPDDEVNSALVDAGLNLITTPGMRGLSKFVTPGGRKTSTALAESFTKGSKPLDQDVINYVQRNPDFQATTGQLSNSPLATGIENVASPLRKREAVRSQQDYLINDFKSQIPQLGTTPEALTQGIKDELLRGEQVISSGVNKLYGDFRSTAKANTIGTGRDAIEGPIYMQESATLANKLLTQLKETFKATDAAGLEKYFNEKERRYINELENLAAGLKANGKVGPVSAEAAKKTKERLGKGIFDKYLPADSAQATERQLHRAIDQDIKGSIMGDPKLGIPGWKNNQQQGLRSWILANKANEVKMQIFKENPGVAGMMDTDLSGIADVRKILSDPVSIERTLQGSANPAATKEFLRSEVLQDVFQKALVKETNQLNPSAALDFFTDRKNDAMIRRLWTPAERQNLTELFKSIHHFDPKVPFAGTQALTIRGIYGGLSLLAALPPLVTAGDLTSGALRGGAVLTALFAGNQMARILSNPKTARLATQLAQTPTKSPRAKNLSRALFVAMKGAQVKLTAPDGTIVGDGIVNDEGKVEPIRVDQ